MIGLGYHDTITPGVIKRNVLENPAWYTAYTPYQPEISQGRLEALLNFQTAVSDLTGLDIANASMLDEATAAAEAMTLIKRTAKSKSQPVRGRRRHAAADHRRHRRPGPSRSASRWSSPTCPTASSRCRSATSSGCCSSYPGASGAVRDHAELIEAAHQREAKVAVATDLLALTLLRPPGEIGADVAVGSSQRFGVPLGFGGPHAGFIAVRSRDAAAAARPAGRRVHTTRTAPPRSGSRCRPASSTSAGRRRPPTSAPRRCCWPSWRRCTRSTTGRTGCSGSPSGCTATRRSLAARLTAGGMRRRARAVLRHASGSWCPGGRRDRRGGPGARHQPVGRRRRRGADQRLRGDHRRSIWRRWSRRSGCRRGTRRPRAALPGGAARTSRVPDPPGVPRAPQRDRDAALPAPALRHGPGAGPHDDPARLLHDEAERHHRDGGGDLAGVRRPCIRSRRSRTPPGCSS